MSGTLTTGVTFQATGSIVAWTVPQTGTYAIVAYGAQGGSYVPFAPNPYENHFIPPNAIPYNGGLGGEAAGALYLTQGEVLEVAVGEAGAEGFLQDGSEVDASEDGGGGGSFVVSASDGAPLVVAGGGGGGDGYNIVGGVGGLGPAGDGYGSSVAGGGAGFYSNGVGSGTITQYYIDGAFLDAESVTPVSADDFADGLVGGTGGSEGRLAGVVSPDDNAGNGGFGGGGGGNAGVPVNIDLVTGASAGGGGGYTGGDPGQGGTSFVSSTAINVVLSPGVQTGDGQVIITELGCFAAGTCLATPSSPRKVETLKAGDLVLSHRRGIPVPVLWVGSRKVDCARHPDPRKVLPVRIRAGAFGPGMPSRNLWLSPDHAVFSDGLLIPVKVLVNGRTVVQEHADRVTYWHVEVDEHDVLLAEGLPVESYLDMGERAAFAGAPVVLMAPDFASRAWEAQGCAPLRVTGPEVDAVRDQLSDRRLCRDDSKVA